MNYSSGVAVKKQQSITKQVKKVDANHFFNLLTSPELLNLVENQLPDHRERNYPPTVTLSMFLGQVMNADSSCQKAVNDVNVNRLFGGLPTLSGSTGGYCIARKRLPLEMVSTLVKKTGELMCEHTPCEWLWQGRHVKIVDGTTILMPDTENNQASYPQHGKQEIGVGSPLARLVGVTSLSTGAILNVAMGSFKGKGTGEHSLFREIKDVIVEGDMLLGDSYYCSYFLIASLRSSGSDVLFEQHGARHTDFRKGKHLGKRDHLSSWSKPSRPSWMSEDEYHSYPDQMIVRELKVAKKVLVTTLLTPKTASKKSLGKLYSERWHVELDLRNIKTTLGMEALSCKTAQMCEKEMWVYLLAYNLIRLLMAEAASQVALLPRQLSFKHTLQIWIAWSLRQFLAHTPLDTEALFILISQVQVGNRPGRVEPRAVKRRPKPYPRLQRPREMERTKIKKQGHDKKLGLN